MWFIAGFITALVVIQFYPPIAKVGEWIVTKAKEITSGT